MPSVTRKTRSSRAQRRAEISARLREVIETLLREGLSYTEVSVERLCADADVSRSTFYTYFEDKGELLRELTADVLNELGAISAEWWERGPEIDYSHLRGIMFRLVSAYRKHDVLLAAVADTSIYDEAVRGVYLNLIEGFIDAITAMIELARERGTVPTNGPAKETAGLLTWMAVHGFYQMARSADQATLERIADAHTEILWCTVHGGARERS
jgi:TetR/AcrR family transcriptional regulator, ethionamide resistance regulator